jgi:hypothetical protein
VIHDEDERLRAMMELSARILNLKEHPCVSVNGPKNLHSAIDLEGHKGHVRLSSLLCLAAISRALISLPGWPVLPD